MAEVVKGLEATPAEATKHGDFGYQHEARLCLGEMEVKLGQAVTRRSGLWKKRPTVSSIFARKAPRLKARDLS